MKTKFKQFLSEKGIDSVEGLSGNELAAYYNEYNEKMQEELKAAIDAKAAASDIQALKAEIAENRNKQYESLRETVKQQGLMLEKVLSVGVRADGEKSFAQQVQAALIANKDNLQKASKDRSVNVKLHIVGKAATDPLLQTAGAGTITGNVPQPWRRPDFVDQKRRMPFVRSLITNISLTESDIVEWVEQQNIEETTGGTAENALKNDMHWEYIVRSERAKMRTVTTKVSTRMLQRVDLMQARINQQLTASLLDDLDQQILFGDGLAENLEGIFPQSTPWAAGAFAATRTNPNNYDVLRIALLQVATAASGLINGAGQSAGFDANYIVVSPQAAAEMDLATGTDGHYILPPFTSSDGTVVKGVPVIESNHLSANQFLVMDGRLAEFYQYESLMIDIGVVNDDFKKNMRTILAEHSALLVIPVNYQGAFVTGDFAAARAALLAP